MKVIKYLASFIYVVGIGPETSLWIKSNVEASLLSFPSSYLFYGYFRNEQLVHTPLENFLRGNPSTIFSLCNYWRYLKFRWTNISCHNFLVLLTWVNKALGYELGRKWENSYALKPWLSTPFRHQISSIEFWDLHFVKIKCDSFGWANMCHLVYRK